MIERLEDTDLFKRMKAYNERWKEEEEEKRQDIELEQKTDYFRRLDSMAKEWIKRYLSLSGIMRNSYGQIVDKCKRLSAMQISHILKEVHNYDVSPEMVGKYKQFLIKEGLLKTDEEFEKERPSEDELRQIRKEGARATSIERSKEKTHLDKKELEEILERKEEEKNDIHSKMIHSKMRELKRKIDENGYCANEGELRELEEYEENKEES